MKGTYVLPFTERKLVRVGIRIPKYGSDRENVYEEVVAMKDER